MLKDRMSFYPEITCNNFIPEKKNRYSLRYINDFEVSLVRDVY